MKVIADVGAPYYYIRRAQELLIGVTETGSRKPEDVKMAVSLLALYLSTAALDAP